MDDSSNPHLSSIPILTEIVPLTNNTPPPALAEQYTQAHNTLNFEGFINPLRAALLEDIQNRLEPVLQERLVQALQPTLEDLALNIRRLIHDEIAILLDEAIKKEKSRRFSEDLKKPDISKAEEKT